MTEEGVREKHYRSGLPGILGTLDTTISKIESVILALGVAIDGAGIPLPMWLSRFVFGNSIMFSEEAQPHSDYHSITFAAYWLPPARHGAQSACRRSTMRLPTGGGRQGVNG